MDSALSLNQILLKWCVSCCYRCKVAVQSFGDGGHHLYLLHIFQHCLIIWHWLVMQSLRLSFLSDRYPDLGCQTSVLYSLSLWDSSLILITETYKMSFDPSQNNYPVIADLFIELLSLWISIQWSDDKMSLDLSQNNYAIVGGLFYRASFSDWTTRLMCQNHKFPRRI